MNGHLEYFNTLERVVFCDSAAIIPSWETCKVL